MKIDWIEKKILDFTQSISLETTQNLIMLYENCAKCCEKFFIICWKFSCFYRFFLTKLVKFSYPSYCWRFLPFQRFLFFFSYFNCSLNFCKISTTFLLFCPSFTTIPQLVAQIRKCFLRFHDFFWKNARRKRFKKCVSEVLEYRVVASGGHKRVWKMYM